MKRGRSVVVVVVWGLDRRARTVRKAVRQIVSEEVAEVGQVNAAVVEGDGHELS